VKEYIENGTFEKYEKRAYGLGFRFVASGSLVRSSYKAAEPFMDGTLSRP
jgi:lipoic acid synthetase